MDEWHKRADSRAYTVLKSSLEKKRLAHGILLHGADLQRLEAVALALARDLLPTAGDPRQHPDCFMLRPANKMRRIGVDATRQLIRNIQQSSNQGGGKVSVIYEADRMPTESANAFLKTLEEPPADTTLFLLTTRPYSILDTIRSRCLRFQVSSEPAPLAQPQWQQWIQDYRHWLEQLTSLPRSRQHIPLLVFSAMALAARFEHLLGALSDEQWASDKADLSEHLPNEEKEAIESGLRKGFRSRLFAKIEVETHAFAISHQIAGRNLASTSLPQIIQRLEMITGLLETNLNESVAIENFLMYSLKTWRSG